MWLFPCSIRAFSPETALPDHAFQPNNTTAVPQLLYPKADEAGIHCFKVLTIARKTIIESAVRRDHKGSPG
jgi:hypothetical protein